MSHQAPPTPDTDPNVNPKAAAKAAKAYAKANRPWFKKKRWWLVGIIALIVIIVVSTNGAGNSGPTVVDNGGSGSSASGNNGSGSSGSGSGDNAKAGSQSNPVKVGQTVELAGTRYTVKKARTAKKIGNPKYFGAKANGTFVIVKLTIENMKNETKTFTEDATKFIAKNGAKYSPDDNGTMAAMGTNNQPLWLADMQPQLPKTGTIVYDVPPSTLKGGLLEVSDLFGEGSAYIKLGLK